MTDQDRTQGGGSADQRPRPQYGEMAPEGWSWSPEGADEGSASAPAAQPQAPSVQPQASPAQPSAGPVPGVPHNLGVSGESGTARPVASTPAAPQPYSSTPPQGAPSQLDAPPQGPPPNQGSSYQGPPPTGAPQQPGAAQSKSRLGDRVVTIALLVLGALGALNFASSLMTMPAQLSVITGALGLDDATIPGWIGTLGTTSAIAMLALFALTAIYSIQRLRARKLAFWVPLTAGVIAFVAFAIVLYSALFGIPEFVQLIGSDPQGALDKLSGAMPSAG